MQEQYIWIDEYGTKRYYKDREMTVYHRTDGPAVEWSNGDKEWYVDGERHRLDGPAIECSNGDKGWWIDNKRLTKEQFNALSEPTLELTLEDIAAKYGVDASKIKIKK